MTAAALLAAAVAAGSPSPPELSPAQLDGLRRAALHAEAPLPGDVVESLAEAALRAGTGLGAADRAEMTAAMRARPEIVSHVLELRSHAAGSRRLAEGPFLVLAPAGFLPDASALHEAGLALRRCAAWTGAEPPSQVPIRVEPGLPTSRSHPPSDVRWGLSTPGPVAPEDACELALLGTVEVPALLGAVALLVGRCGGDADCRGEVLAQARDTARSAGLTGFLDATSAGVVGSLRDPALAGAVLAVERLERRGADVAALARALPRAAPRAEAARILRATAGVAPERLDVEIRRELRRRDPPR